MQARGLSLAPRPAGFPARDAVEIVISAPAMADLAVTVFDEYGDARPDNPWLCLILVARAFEALDDGFEDWARGEMIEPDAAARLVFEALTAARTLFETAHGSIPDRVSQWDFELNAGEIQSLRKWRAG
jgi:hypothetical protein